PEQAERPAGITIDTLLRMFVGVAPHIQLQLVGGRVEPVVAAAQHLQVGLQPAGAQAQAPVVVQAMFHLGEHALVGLVPVGPVGAEARRAGNVEEAAIGMGRAAVPVRAGVVLAVVVAAQGQRGGVRQVEFGDPVQQLALVAVGIGK
ncbi:hypothetical protein QT21_00140, partial [Staphylococcus aureus]